MEVLAKIDMGSSSSKVIDFCLHIHPYMHAYMNACMYVYVFIYAFFWGFVLGGGGEFVEGEEKGDF